MLSMGVKAIGTQKVEKGTVPRQKHAKIVGTKLTCNMFVNKKNGFRHFKHLSNHGVIRDINRSVIFLEFVLNPHSKAPRCNSNMNNVSLVGTNTTPYHIDKMSTAFQWSFVEAFRKFSLEWLSSFRAIPRSGVSKTSSFSKSSSIT